MRIFLTICAGAVVVLGVVVVCAAIALVKCPDADHRWY